MYFTERFLTAAYSRMEAVKMESKAYEYMDWPRIEAIVYGEEASPKDVMAPQSDNRRCSGPGIFSGGR